MRDLKAMSFVEHLTELRKRLIWVILILGITMFVGFAVARPIILYLRSIEPASGMEWNVFSPWDTIRIYMQVAVMVSFAATLPVILYHLWAFMKPGLKENEQRATLIYIPFAFLLFLAGLAFGYFVVFPLAFYFTTVLTSALGLTETYGVAQYFSFMFNILLPVSLLFELPVVVLFLTRIRILQPNLLTKFRKVAYLLLLIIGALITPPDVISALIVAVPMILLYEFSVLLSKWLYGKQLAKDKAREEAFDAEESV